MTSVAARVLAARIAVADRDVDVSVTVPAGRTLAIVGANGSGKSTILDALAGLVPLTAGHVRLGDRTLAEPARRRDVAPHLRGVARLGQDPLLFPHLSLRGNVAFGLRAAGIRRREARAEALHWLDRTGVSELADRRPAQVSGGQAQRAAVSRALAVRPALSLWDEPFAALDIDAAPLLRTMLARELAGRTAVLVTHDLADVAVLADRVLVLERGRVAQDAAAADFLASPAAGFAERLSAAERLPGFDARLRPDRS